MKLTCLIENQEAAGLCSEHGLAVHIEYQGHSILLDTGASNRFLANCDQLGIDLSKVELAVLSHGHFDHSGGYEGFFARNRDALVYCREGADGAFYGSKREYIGMPDGLIARYPERFRFLTGDQQLLPGVWLIPDKKSGMPTPMLELRDGAFLPDEFHHEQSLVLEGESGLVILNSCCHSGVAEIVEGIAETFPGRPIAAVVGGFHFMGPGGAETLGVPPERVEAVCQKLRALGVKSVYTCHCTGLPGFQLVKEQLGACVSYFGTGARVEIV